MRLGDKLFLVIRAQEHNKPFYPADLLNQMEYLMTRDGKQLTKLIVGVRPRFVHGFRTSRGRLRPLSSPSFDPLRTK
jgi:hypothetical protein